MGKNSGIAWCHHTMSPWWGCVEVSPACDFCYAREWDSRWGGDNWGKEGERRFFGDKHWNEPKKWDREAAKTGEQTRVFCASMCDVFESYDILEPHRVRLWKLIEDTSHLTWLLLTKRPQNINKMLPASLHGAQNIWLGTTVESPSYTWRIDAVCETPAPVHFLSMEPLLEETHIEKYLDLNNGINWVIAGAESGKKARFTPTDWYRGIRNQCLAKSIPMLLKQAPRGADGITSGEGSWIKISTPACHADGKVRAGMIEQPYLDGTQWIQYPKSTAIQSNSLLL